MLDAAGIKARVCNAYYSGCPLQSHWEWWKSGEANYEFYVTDENGRAKTESANLEYCLSQGNWDIISLQESTHKIRGSGAEQHFTNTQNYLTDLWGYIKEQFPQSRYFWHQPWVYEVGCDRNGIQITSLAQQHNMMLNRRAYDLLVCDAYDYERVNTGETWQYVRESGYGTLCAKLGVGTPLHSGDFSHDGDIGGGQLLNACVWFEILTGLDCTKTAYAPVYTYKNEVMENLFDADTIKSSAHAAVAAMKNGGCIVSLEQFPIE